MLMVVGIFQSQRESTRHTIAATLHNVLMNADARDDLVKQGVSWALAKLLATATSKTTKAICYSTIMNLICYPHLQAAALESTSVTHLLEEASQAGGRIMQSCALCILSVARSSDLLQALISGGVVQKMLELLRASPPDVGNWCLYTLAWLSSKQPVSNVAIFLTTRKLTKCRFLRVDISFR